MLVLVVMVILVLELEDGEVVDMTLDVLVEVLLGDVVDGELVEMEILDVEILEVEMLEVEMLGVETMEETLTGRLLLMLLDVLERELVAGAVTTETVVLAGVVEEIDELVVLATLL